MSVRTILLDFSVDPLQTQNKSQTSLISTNIENILRDYLSNLKHVTNLKLDDGIFKLYSADFGAIVNLRINLSGLITLSIEYIKPDDKEPLLSYDKVKALERDISERAQGILKSRAIVPIKRDIFPRYYPTSDDRLLEYDLDKIIFEEKSQFQKVQIINSKSLGKMLVLDDLQNMSERDLIYTDTLMQRGKESYTGKEIVILGGGDGHLLHELLKENPKEVIMLEIDDVVIKACAKHMRSLCGDVLDKMTGPNYKIIVDDCMKALEQYIKEERKFDYVFGDLTDVPISDDAELWAFTNKSLQKAFKVLKPTGKFMTHVAGTVCKESLKIYESYLSKIEPAVEFTKCNAFIPCFMEDWVFCQVGFVQKQ